ncbi:SAM-dependent methyltransferase [Solitalea longa]|uniref:SAM-dependent methyltransferase n=1 Tax=Solitalea longa TaxID=2079460 RepID=A0A2S4ZX10_9SPHI|nr:class I SAM-dependent methyltransferase [Solitalea longa]POY34826.1 SAM-dependent methyltransferase [Solitalea longa]
MKDNFSKQAHLYAQFRPGYSNELIDFVINLVAEKEYAWDCGSGNGQVAAALATHFKTVYATDISQQQLDNAIQKENIHYLLSAAEETPFSENQFNLITVAQAIHWFNFEKFYAEVNRTLKPNGILAVIGYGLLSIDPETDAIIRYFYTDIIGSYWDKERSYIDEKYHTIPFPFVEIKTPTFFSFYSWNREQFIGYLTTWSAVQHYKDHNKKNPVDLIINQLEKAWPVEEKRSIIFPNLLRVGKIRP